jgi:hypothetical protein
MIKEQKKKLAWWKWLLIIGAIVFVIGASVIWYLFNLKFEDTATLSIDHTVNGMEMINEFVANDTVANKKYTETFVVVKGRVSEMENADTTVNIKMIDSLTDAYIIFAFQEKSAAEAKSLKVGDSVAIKGSCSGGTYSEILETTFISFKRCTLIK